MPPSVDLMVKILTDANTEGIKATEKSLDALTESANSGAKSTTASMGNLQGTMADVKDVAAALARVSRGDLGPALQQLQGLTNSQSQALSRLGGAGGSAFIGWQIGSVLDEVLGLSDAISRAVVPLDNVDRGARLSKESLDEMSRVTMANLQSQLDGLNEALDRLDRSRTVDTRAKIAAVSAEADRDIAALEAQPQSPERDRTIVNRKAERDAQILDIERQARADELAQKNDAIKALERERQGIADQVRQREAEFAAADAAMLEAQRRGDDMATSPTVVARGNAQALLSGSQNDQQSFEALYQQRKFDYELRIRELEAERQVDPVRRESAGIKTSAAHADIANKEQAAAAKAQADAQTAAAKAQAEADKARVANLETQLQELQSRLAQLQTEGPTRLAAEQAQAVDAQEAAKSFAALSPMERGQGSIARLRELRERAAIETREVSEVGEQLVAAQMKTMGQIAELRRKLEEVINQARNAEQ